jgi:cell division protein FtsB
MNAPLRRIGFVVAAAAFAGYAIRSLAGPKGLSAWRDKERQIQVLEQSNAELKRQNEAARERIDRLRSDPAEQERVIEERLKLAHPGEKVFVLPGGKK